MPRSSLSGGERDEMLQLMRRHFQDVDRAQFERDLAEKHWVLQLRDPAGGLRGFSTLMRLEWQSLQIFFSGDTIVDESMRGGGELARSWSRHVFELAAQAAPTPCYWFLLCSGYRTYRFLPVFFREFYPRHERRTPAFEQTLLDELARARFGELYQDGVVRLGSGLRASCIDPGRLHDPHIDFFLRQNPQHAKGHELACVARITPDNLTPCGHRVAQR